ncbi:hypothetical protein [Janthinobacterium lividum]|uniref:hypothetical protein n=1 Tax=Janthinobacterium lividum TaxID=29581 RepID=UPI00140C8865|nr:hypothetical protein [Janthinobacterium lividum]NHQ90910.1 hypothetical protein [Janthinobacterium lividum]
MKFAFGIRRAAAPAARKRARSSASRGAPVLLFFVIVILALFMGAIIGLDSPVLVTLFGGAIFVALVFFMLNAYQLLLAVFVLTFLVQGSAVYFLSNRQAPWVVVGLTALFALRALMELMFSRTGKVKPDTGTADTGVMVSLLVYAMCFCASTVLNRPSTAQLIVAIKSSWPMFGLLLAFAWGRWHPERLSRLWWILIVVAMVQLPVTIYQHFFISSGRTFAAHDAVVGTFGGNPLGGGNSALLVMFVIAVMSYSLALWNRGLMTGMRAGLICAVCLAVILLGEVKAAFIWMPIALFFVLRKRIMKNLLTLIWYGLLAVVLGGTIYLTYNALYWGKQLDSQHTLSGKLKAGGGYFFDPNSVSYETGEVGRGASIAIWAQDHLATTPTRLIGYGPGAVKSGPGLGAGPLYQRFAPLHVDSIAISVLLWDLGLVGCLAYVSMMLFGIRAGWRYVKEARGSPLQMAIVETSTGLLVLFASLLIYNRTLMDDPGSQLLFVFCLSCILQIVRFGAQTDAPPQVHGVQATPHGRAWDKPRHVAAVSAPHG